MNPDLVSAGITILIVIFLCGTVVNTADDWGIPVTGPDG